jgi:ferric-chelate reductase
MSTFVAHVRWIEEALVKAVQLAPPSLAISIRIFITRSLPMTESQSPDSVSLSPIEKKGTHDPIVIMSDPSLLSLLSGVEVNHGRPNLDALLKEEASITSGRMSVSGKYANLRHVQATYRPTVCGSQGIARAVRRALRFPVSGSSTRGPSVTLHVESFGYA